MLLMDTPHSPCNPAPGLRDDDHDAIPIYFAATDFRLFSSHASRDLVLGNRTRSHFKSVLACSFRRIRSHTLSACDRVQKYSSIIALRCTAIDVQLFSSLKMRIVTHARSVSGMGILSRPYTFSGPVCSTVNVFHRLAHR